MLTQATIRERPAEQLARAADDDESQGLPRDRRTVWLSLAGVLLAMQLASLDQTIVGPAMPHIIADLRGFDRYAWVTAVYMLTSVVTMPLFGKLSDIHGRKLFFLFGVALFVSGSALTGMSQTMTQLIVFRGLQGIGAGALIPIAMAVVGDLFPPKERGKVQGAVASHWIVAAIIGPSAGGWITDHASWRWIFYLNLPVGVVAFLTLWLVMPPHRRSGDDVTIDFAGVVLLLVGLIPLLLALGWAGTTYAWSSPQIVGMLSGAAFVLVVFAVYEMRQTRPIVDPRLFENRIFLVSVLATMLVGAALFGGILYIPLFVQGVVGSSALRSGAILTPMTVMALGGGLLSGQLMSRWGRYRFIALAGLALMVAGYLLLTQLTVRSTNDDVLVAMILLGAGMGLGMPLYVIVVQNAFPYSMLGQVTGALTFFRSIGGTLGVAVMGSLLTSRYAGQLARHLPSALTEVLPPSRLGALDNPQALIAPAARASLQHALAVHGTAGTSLLPGLLAAIKESLAAALHTIFVSGLAIVALAFVAVLFLQEVPLRATNSTPTDEALADAGASTDMEVGIGSTGAM